MTTSAITMKIIFTGLLAFSLPEGSDDAFVAALAVEGASHTGHGFPEHEARLYLLEGGCGTDAECDGAGWSRMGRVRFITIQEKARLRIDDGIDDAQQRPLLVDGRARSSIVPASEDEVRALSWIPSMDRIMRWRNVRMEAECRHSDQLCDDAHSRFFVRQGMVTNCHLIHRPDPLYQPVCSSPLSQVATREVDLVTYELRHHGRQAIGDAVLVEDTLIGKRSIELVESESSKRWRLFPDANGNITLVVGQFPLTQENETSTVPVKDLEHFRHLYPLGNAFSFRKHIPRSPLAHHTPSPPGACEAYLVCLQEELREEAKRRVALLAAPPPGSFKLQSVHIPAKCDTATYP
jgi:hypothetical protein